MVRIELDIPEDERQRFATQAGREGKTLDAWLLAVARQRIAAPVPAENASESESAVAAPNVDVGQSILDMFDELHRSAPEGAFDELPTDGSRNFKHYLYGWPKEEDER